jgi:hypothetical protein
VVKGLDVFRDYFTGHAEQFVLIGGTAASLAMEDAGLAFRATKDLDIVLHIEALTSHFSKESRLTARTIQNPWSSTFRFLRSSSELCVLTTLNTRADTS